jgi:hypothetical protein
MTRRAALIIAALFYSNAAAAPLVTFESPCECRDNHGKHRWSEKNDPALPPSDTSAIQAVTPSDIFNWQGPTEFLKASSERIAAEQKWYALTGRVVDLRVEEDGDLHIALQDLCPVRARERTVLDGKHCTMASLFRARIMPDKISLVAVIFHRLLFQHCGLLVIPFARRCIRVLSQCGVALCKMLCAFRSGAFLSNGFGNSTPVIGSRHGSGFGRRVARSFLQNVHASGSKFLDESRHFIPLSLFIMAGAAFGYTMLPQSSGKHSQRGSSFIS